MVGEDVHKDPHIDWVGSFSLTPHMWDEQNEPRWGPKGPRRKGGGQDKERNGRKEEVGGHQEREQQHPSAHPIAGRHGAEIAVKKRRMWVCVTPPSSAIGSK